MRIPIKGTVVPNDYKDFYSFWGIETTCPGDIEFALSEAKSDDEVVFEINSGGGEIFSGAEIYSKIRGYAGNKRIEIVGLAGSAASVIACAARSSITPTGMMMIHNVQSGCEGDWQAFAHESEVLRECSRAIAAAYREKTGMTEEELLSLMDKEEWMTAERATALGLVDEILPAANGLYNSVATILTPEQIKEARSALSGKAVEQEKLNLLKLRR